MKKNLMRIVVFMLIIADLFLLGACTFKKNGKADESNNEAPSESSPPLSNEEIWTSVANAAKAVDTYDGSYMIDMSATGLLVYKEAKSEKMSLRAQASRSADTQEGFALLNAYSEVTDHNSTATYTSTETQKIIKGESSYLGYQLSENNGSAKTKAYEFDQANSPAVTGVFSNILLLKSSLTDINSWYQAPGTTAYKTAFEELFRADENANILITTSQENGTSTVSIVMECKIIVSFDSTEKAVTSKQELVYTESNGMLTEIYSKTSYTYPEHFKDIYFYYGDTLESVTSHAIEKTEEVNVKIQYDFNKEMFDSVNIETADITPEKILTNESDKNTITVTQYKRPLRVTENNAGGIIKGLIPEVSIVEKNLSGGVSFVTHSIEVDQNATAAIQIEALDSFMAEISPIKHIYYTDLALTQQFTPSTNAHDVDHIYAIPVLSETEAYAVTQEEILYDERLNWFFASHIKSYFTLKQQNKEHLVSFYNAEDIISLNLMQVAFGELQITINGDPTAEESLTVQGGQKYQIKYTLTIRDPMQALWLFFLQ